MVVIFKGNTFASVCNGRDAGYYHHFESSILLFALLSVDTFLAVVQELTQGHSLLVKADCGFIDNLLLDFWVSLVAYIFHYLLNFSAIHSLALIEILLTTPLIIFLLRFRHFSDSQELLRHHEQLCSSLFRT